MTSKVKLLRSNTCRF